jgi:hypothetical protein
MLVPCVMRIGKAVAPLFLAQMLFLLGCKIPLCNPQADAPSYRVSVIETYDSSTRFHYQMNSGFEVTDVASCAGSDGIASGAVLELQKKDDVPDFHGTCEYVSAELVSGPSQITVLGLSSDSQAIRMAQNSWDFIYSVDQVQVGSCAGILTLELGFGDGASRDIYATPIPGRDSPVILRRLFQPSDPACTPCGDPFVVQLSKG